MEFVKMHGLGNDFIILDDTDHRQKNGREDFETEKHCCEESELSPELVQAVKYSVLQSEVPY